MKQHRGKKRRIINSEELWQIMKIPRMRVKKKLKNTHSTNEPLKNNGLYKKNVDRLMLKIVCIRRK